METEKVYCNKPKKVYCIDLDTEYPSIVNCARTLGLSSHNLRKVLQGKRKTCMGYRFRFVEEGEEHGEGRVPEESI